MAPSASSLEKKLKALQKFYRHYTSGNEETDLEIKKCLEEISKHIKTLKTSAKQEKYIDVAFPELGQLLKEKNKAKTNAYIAETLIEIKKEVDAEERLDTKVAALETFKKTYDSGTSEKNSAVRKYVKAILENVETLPTNQAKDQRVDIAFPELSMQLKTGDTTKINGYIATTLDALIEEANPTPAPVLNTQPISSQLRTQAPTPHPSTTRELALVRLSIYATHLSAAYQTKVNILNDEKANFVVKIIAKLDMKDIELKQETLGIVTEKIQKCTDKKQAEKVLDTYEDTLSFHRGFFSLLGWKTTLGPFLNSHGKACVKEVKQALNAPSAPNQPFCLPS